MGYGKKAWIGSAGVLNAFARGSPFTKLLIVKKNVICLPSKIPFNGLKRREEGRKEGEEEGRDKRRKEGREEGGRKEGRKEGWKEGRMEGRKEGRKEGKKEYVHGCVCFCKTKHATVSLLGMFDYLCDFVIMWGTFKYIWEIMLCDIVIMLLCKYVIM